MSPLTDFDPSWLSQYIIPNYSPYPIWLERGDGPYVWDQNGKKYIDFAGGVAVCPLGHAHPEVTEAISRQAGTLIHVSNWFCIRQQAQLARLIVEEFVQLPGKCFFSNSGAEANEGMIKLARKYGVQRPLADGSPRYEIITFHGSFHGRTFGAMSATAQEKIHGGFGPIVPGFVYVNFNDAEAVRAAITERTVAIMLEPIQGESGIQPAQADFLRTLQQLCYQHDLLLLMDEVQCGFGRTGETCGWRSIVPGREIQPDAISWAKSIGSGYPLGAFWVKKRPLGPVQSGAETPQLCDLLGPGTHGTTYGGSPLACTVGITTLGTILRDGLPQRALQMGRYILTEITRWQQPWIKEVRGYGMMLGIEIDEAALNALPAAQAYGKPASLFLAKQLLDAGLLTVPAGPKVIRWLPPLNITQAQADEALAILKHTFTQLSA
jgi:acetylornithine/N-succinyldiaminopimelate aminotransferase